MWSAFNLEPAPDVVKPSICVPFTLPVLVLLLTPSVIPPVLVLLLPFAISLVGVIVGVVRSDNGIPEAKSNV